MSEKTLPDPGTLPADEVLGAERLPAAPASPLSTTPEARDASSDARGDRVRCPTCHNPITLGQNQSDEVLCPACGGTFRVRDCRPTSTTSEMQQLGKFQLLERVGLGAFGAVWKARDTELDRIVALKIPHAGLVATAAEQERFQREARAAAQLRHPNIVTVHEVAALNGLPALVSDFVHGVPLRDLLQVRRLTFRESAALAAELAEALDYAHRMGVVHRDVKPGNVLLERGQPGSAEADGVGRPLLADFGLALRGEAEVTMTVEGQVLGTPAYMSPEQASGMGHRVDGRSDVYSLGVMLYELLTGELPFRGSKAMILDQVLREEPRRPRRVNDKVPRDLETICLKALAKEPARRYPSARELADDLRRFLRGEPIKARPVGRLKRAWRWSRRNPTVAFLSTVSAFAALTLVGVLGTSAAIVYGKNRDLERINNDLEQTNKNLEQTNKDLDDQRKRTDEERARVEATLARSLLRPLGHESRSSSLNSAEVEAVWDLAENTSDRVRLLFIEDALRRPETARRLRNRRVWAVHAAVGLNRGRRHQVEEILLARLRDRQADGRVREDTALIGTALGDPGPEFAQEAARVLVESMTKTTDPIALSDLAGALSSLPGRLEPPEAAAHTAQAARSVVEAMTKTTNFSALSGLDRAMSSLAGRLEPQEAAALAPKVVEAMAKTTDPIASHALAQALSSLAGRLEPQEAAALAPKVVEAMAKTTDPHPLPSLAEALSSLAARLGPPEAAAHTAKAARVVVEAMAKTRDPSVLSSLARALSSLAGRLEPLEAAALVVEVMTKTTDPSALSSLEKTFLSLAGRLEPPEAAALARVVVEVMAKTTDPSALPSLAKALSSLAGRLEPPEAAAHTAKGARRLIEAMAANHPAPPSLTQALSWLASPVGPGEAADRAVVVARALGEEASPPTRLSGLATLLQASQLSPCRFSTQELVDLLKMPTCVGPAREVVLRLLGQKCNRHFADQWEFVDYAEKHLPDIDLKSPPKRPQP